MSRLARWRIKLSEYDFEIVYKPGKINCNADALSRNPHDSVSSSALVSDSPNAKTVAAIKTFSAEDEVDPEELLERVFVCFEALEHRALESNVTGIEGNVSSIPSNDKNIEATHDQSTEAPCLATSVECSPLGTPVSICANATQHFGSDSWGRKRPEPGSLEGPLKDKDANPESRDTALSDDSIIASPGGGPNDSVTTPSSTLSGRKGAGVDSKTQNVVCAGEGQTQSFELVSVPEKTPLLVISDACISYSNDKIYMGRGHIAHFVSADGAMKSETNKELIDRNLFKVEDFLDGNPQIGEVMVFTHNNRYVFGLIVKRKYDEQLFLNHISSAVAALKNAMETLKVKSVKISKKGNDLDQVSWLSIEQIFRQQFIKSELLIVICSGEVIIPPKQERDEIIRQFHESAVGGHKGSSKCYWTLRSRYYWENMQDDVRRIIASCKNCQRNKLLRRKTRMPMLITDTPKEPFEKIQVDLVGPLPVTLKGNTHILTIQCVFSKYCEAIPIKDTDSVTIATTIAE